MEKKIDYVVGVKDEKKAANMARVAKVITELKGERSIRRMAEETGVAASYITGILKEKYLPSADILRKLADSSANPQNGVALEDLMIAAGYQDNYVEGVMPDGLLDELEDDNNSGVEERLSRYTDAMARHKQDRQERVRFNQIASGAVLKALYENGIKFGSGEDGSPSAVGFKPDFSVTVAQEPILDWWFVFKHVKDVGSAINRKHIIRHYIERFMFLDPVASRKISVVVDDEEVFYELSQYKNHLSYRGDLSVILLSPDDYSIVKEQYIAYYFENGEKGEFTIV